MTTATAQSEAERIFLEGRTARTFTADPVSDAELDRIWELASLAPSAFDAQPLRVLFVRTRTGKQTLLPLVSDGNKPKVDAAPVTAILAIDERYHELVDRPSIAELLERDADTRARSGELSTGIGIGAFILAVRATGLAAGPMAGFDNAAVDAAFFEDTTWRSRLLVNIGHPGEGAWRERLARVPVERAVRWA